MDYIVYVLINTKNVFTYVGTTNNLTKRMKQHNGEIKGGAKYTRNKKMDGIWICYCYIKNLEKKQAYSIEKQIKIKSRKINGISSLNKRLISINHVLNHNAHLNNIEFINNF